MLRPVRIGEWEQIGRSRALVQRTLGELGANELAAHVTINSDNERQRILIATDIGLLDYNFGPSSEAATYELRGTLHRWPSLRGMRLQSDAQWDDNAKTARSIWRLIAEEPPDRARRRVHGGRSQPDLGPARLRPRLLCLPRQVAHLPPTEMTHG
jgi:hypothetical protein